MGLAEASDEPSPPPADTPGRGERIYVRILWAIILISAGFAAYLAWLAYTMLG
ncbi:MAG: hypothetical protein WAK18_13935 [Nocardioidaceae bacterium]